MACKCEDCAWLSLRNLNPALLPEQISKICFGNVWRMTEDEHTKDRECVAHTIED
jgi:hypothetical protein